MGLYPGAHVPVSARHAERAARGARPRPLRGRRAAALIRARLLDGRARRARRPARRHGARRWAHAARSPARDALPGRRARDARAQGAGVRAAAAAHARPRRGLQGARGPAGLPGGGDDRPCRRQHAGGGRRPGAPRGRREPRRHLGRRAARGARRPAPARQPRLRRQSEDVLRPGDPRRRRRGRDGARRQPVRPRAGRPDGQADPVRHRRRGDRLAPARGRGHRGRHAALEVGGEPLPDDGREPRVPARLLRVPHRLPGLLDRVPALDRLLAQRRRLCLRPGDLRPDGRAARPRGRAADPHPLLPRGVHRLVRRKRGVRPAHARRAGALPPRRAPPALAAPAPARGSACRPTRASDGRTRLPRGELAGARGRRVRRPPGRLEHGGAGARQGGRAGHRRSVGRCHHALPGRLGLRTARAGARVRADVRAAGRPRPADGRGARDQPRPGADRAPRRQHVDAAARSLGAW